MKQLVLIMEGTDRSGKSTIGRMIADRLEIPYFKYVHDKEALSGSDMTSKMLKYADPYFIDFLKQTKTSVVIDRHYPSEWVYSQALERDTDIDGLRRTDELFAELPAVILIMKRKSYATVNDDDPRLNSEGLTKISEFYGHFAKWSHCRVVTLEFEDWDPGRMVLEALEALKDYT